jgi:hypothetical protein
LNGYKISLVTLDRWVKTLRIFIEVPFWDTSNFNFYTGDVPSEYLIHIEGITEDSRPFSVKKILEFSE